MTAEYQQSNGRYEAEIRRREGNGSWQTHVLSSVVHRTSIPEDNPAILRPLRVLSRAFAISILRSRTLSSSASCAAEFWEPVEFEWELPPCPPALFPSNLEKIDLDAAFEREEGDVLVEVDPEGEDLSSFAPRWNERVVRATSSLGEMREYGDARIRIGYASCSGRTFEGRQVD